MIASHNTCIYKGITMENRERVYFALIWALREESIQPNEIIHAVNNIMGHIPMEVPIEETERLCRMIELTIGSSTIQFNHESYNDMAGVEGEYFQIMLPDSEKFDAVTYDDFGWVIWKKSKRLVGRYFGTHYDGPGVKVEENVSAPHYVGQIKEAWAES